MYSHLLPCVAIEIFLLCFGLAGLVRRYVNIARILRYNVITSKDKKDMEVRKEKKKLYKIKEDLNVGSKSGVFTKKIEYLRGYRKLKLQEEFLEKNLLSAIKNIKIDGELVREIENNHLNNFSNRQPELQALERSTLDSVKELKTLKSMLRQEDPESTIRNLNVEDCRSKLTKLLNNIKYFKDKRNLEKLREEELILDSELREYERKILTERKNPLQKRIGERKCPTRTEVNDRFVELVARTGHTQGWSEDDHSFFLKLRVKYDSVPQLVNELRIRRPHLTNEEIINHEAWYKLYLELREKRKKDIAEWRLKCKEQKLKQESNNHREDVKEMSSVSRIKNSSSVEKKQKNIEKKRMIEEWKAERARKLAMDEEQKKRLEIERSEKERKRRDSLRNETKIKLQQEYNNNKEKTKKSLSEPNLRSNLNRMSKKPDSTWLLKSFREEDKKFVQRRLSSLKALKKVERILSADSAIEKKLLRSSGNPISLLRPTKGWEEKCKGEKKMEEKFGRINYVKDIQKLGAPR